MRHCLNPAKPRRGCAARGLSGNKSWGFRPLPSLPITSTGGSRRGNRPGRGPRAKEFMETKPVITLEPSRGLVSLNLRDLWEYRELLFFLTWRDIKVRYKQTLLGAAWAVIQPFFTMVVFSLFFGKLAGVPSDGVPYPHFHLRGAGALDLLRLQPDPVGQQPGGQRQPHSEGLFPAPGHPHLQRALRSGGFFPGLRGPPGHDAVLRVLAGDEDALAGAAPRSSPW